MRFRDVVDLVLLAAVWGASYLFMRIGAPEFGVVALVYLRLLVGALCLLPVLHHRRGFGEIAANWKLLTQLGFYNSVLPFLLLTYSTLFVSGGFSAVINATAPLWGALIGWLWLSDSLSRSAVAGLLLGFAGVAILAADRESLAMAGSGLAVLAAAGGALCYGVGANFTKRYARHIDSLAVATGSLLLPAVILVPAAVLAWPATPPSLHAWIAVLLMGALSTGFAYILYFRLIANVGPAKAISVAYLIPAFAVLFGALLLDEKVTLSLIHI